MTQNQATLMLILQFLILMLLTGKAKADVEMRWIPTPGIQYQACYQPLGQAEQCSPDNTGSHLFITEPDTEYDFWYKADGTDSPKTRHRTQKKTLTAPNLVEH